MIKIGDKITKITKIRTENIQSQQKGIDKVKKLRKECKGKMVKNFSQKMA